MEALKENVKSMDLWDLVIYWMWDRKKATHIFLVCSSKKIVIPGPAKRNTDGRAALGSWKMTRSILYMLNLRCLQDSKVKMSRQMNKRSGSPPGLEISN